MVYLWMVLKMVHFGGQTLYCPATEMVPLNLGLSMGEPLWTGTF